MSASSHTTESPVTPSLSPHTLSCLFFQFNYLLPLKHLQQFICGKNTFLDQSASLRAFFFFPERDNSHLRHWYLGGSWVGVEGDVPGPCVCKWEGVSVHWCSLQLFVRGVFVPCNQNSPSWLIELTEWILDVEVLKVGKDWTSVLDWL